MSIAVSLEEESQKKQQLLERLTALLPAWFGQPQANRLYAKQAALLPGYVARCAGEAKGLLVLKTTSAISAEIYWLGVDPDLHRSGIGRALVETAQRDCRMAGVKFLFVCTLHPDEADEHYGRTRRFYEAMGFNYVLEEQFPRERNRLAYFMKQIGS